MAAKLTSRGQAWDRDDRDLLIELKTNMLNISNEVAAARVELKEINTGISARLLNLESNAVSKIELEKMAEDIENLKGCQISKEERKALEARIADLEAWRNYLLGAYALGILIIGFAFNYYT